MGLSTTIIATRRRPILILHLEAKIYCQNEIYAKNWVMSTWTAKVNSDKKSTVKVNAGQRPGQRWRQLMMWQWWRHLGLTSVRGTWRVTARGGAWGHVTAREGAWRRVSSCTESFGGAWGHVAAPMMVRFPREGRSVEEDLSGTCKNTIGARITATTLWQWSRDYEWRRLQVQN